MQKRYDLKFWQVYWETGYISVIKNLLEGYKGKGKGERRGAFVVITWNDHETAILLFC